MYLRNCGSPEIYNYIKTSKKKLALYGTDGRLFATDVCAKFKATKKLGQMSKIWPDKIYILCPSLKIRG